MDLYIVRHAIAFDRNKRRWPDDGKRPLTPDGVRKFRKAAAGLKSAVGRVDAVLSSPFVRAWDTAILLQKHARWPKPQACKALEPGGSREQVLAAITREKGKRIALVGHEPDLTELTAACLGTGELPLDFKKGGAVHLEFANGVRAGSATLRAVLPPRLLRRLAD